MSFPKRLDVLVIDRNGDLIPEVDIMFLSDGHVISQVEGAMGRASLETESLASIEVVIEYAGKERTRDKISLLGNNHFERKFTLKDVEVNPKQMPIWLPLLIALFLIVGGVLITFYLGVEQHLPLVIAAVLLGLAVLLAFTHPKPSTLQRQIILGTFCLAGAAAAVYIPGLINVNINLGEKIIIGAVGALAVFVIFYFRKPAGTDDE